MTILGIAGGTALILTGFGIKDSITATGVQQYGDVIHYLKPLCDWLMAKSQLRPATFWLKAKLIAARARLAARWLSSVLKAIA